MAAVAAILAIAPVHLLKIDKWPANAAVNFITFDSVERLNAIAARVIHLGAAQQCLRIVLTGVIMFGILCFAFFFFRQPRGHGSPQQEEAPITWTKLGVMLVPFSAVYILLVAVRLAFFDRYFLPLLAILFLVLTRLYQERVSAKLPGACVLVIVFFAGFSLVATHDAFALYRGYVVAVDEIQSSGAPATAILGPGAYEGWAELEKAGHLNDPVGASKRGRYLSQLEQNVPAKCDKDLFGLILLGMVPDIRPAYAMSFNPNECGGQVAFPLVTYRTWIVPHVNTIYAVRLPSPFSY